MAEEQKGKDFSDVLLDVKREIALAYSNQDWKSVTANIDGLIRKLNGEDGVYFDQRSRDDLSKLGGNLAILRASLIQQKMEAFRNIRIIKERNNIRKANKREGIKLKLTEKAKANGQKPPTIDDINVTLDSQMAENGLLLSMHEAEYEKLQNYWYAIPDILFRIETRISVLSGDKNTTKFADDRVVAIPEVNQPTGIIDFIPSMSATVDAAPIGS